MLQTTQLNFEKLLAQQVFENPTFNPCNSFSSLSIRTLFCVCCYLYLLLMLLAVVVLFHSIWWQFVLAVTISKIQPHLPIEAHDHNNGKNER